MLRNGRERVPPLSVVLGMSNAAASHISIQLGLGASSATYSVACASSAAPVRAGLPQIPSGEATPGVAGGPRTAPSYRLGRARGRERLTSPGGDASPARGCSP